MTTTAVQQIERDFAMAADDIGSGNLWEIINRYRAELVNQAYALLSSQEEAEDVVQETFIEAFRHREKLAEVESMSAWLRTINRVNALDRLRKNQRNERKISRSTVVAPTRNYTTGGFSDVILRDQVAKAIETLDDKHRAVVVLFYWEHLSADEIALRLNLAPRTIRHQLLEAYQILFERLQGNSPTDAAPPTEEGNPS